jgi:serine/threonine protein kinase
VLQQGSIVGSRYEVVDLLGGGGMKQVWLARDRRLGGRTCALAEMIDSFRTATARLAAEAAFKREAELLASLSNEHIPRVYDSFSGTEGPNGPAKGVQVRRRPLRLA